MILVDTNSENHIIPDVLDEIDEEINSQSHGGKNAVRGDGGTVANGSPVKNVVASGRSDEGDAHIGANLEEKIEGNANMTKEEIWAKRLKDIEARQRDF
jgi:hypothetical protein